MSRLIVSSIVLSLTASFASSEIKRMSDEVIVEVVRKIAPNREIKHRLDAINPPTMVFVWHGSRGDVRDVMSEKDPFTGDKKYKHSVISCNYDVTYFTPILNTDVHIDGAIYLRARNKLGYKNLWIGMGKISGGGKILSSDPSQTLNKIVFGGGIGGEDKFSKQYSSNQEAVAAIDEECSLSNIQDIEISDMTALSWEGHGYLIRGEKDRIPEFGNSTIFIIE